MDNNQHSFGRRLNYCCYSKPAVYTSIDVSSMAPLRPRRIPLVLSQMRVGRVSICANQPRPCLSPTAPPKATPTANLRFPVPSILFVLSCILRSKKCLEDLYLPLMSVSITRSWRVISFHPPETDCSASDRVSSRLQICARGR